MLVRVFAKALQGFHKKLIGQPGYGHIEHFLKFFGFIGPPLRVYEFVQHIVHYAV